MSDHQEIIKQLTERIGILSRKQESFKYEIFDLKTQLDKLQAAVLNNNNVIDKEVEAAQISQEETELTIIRKEWEVQHKENQPSIEVTAPQTDALTTAQQSQTTPQTNKQSPLRKSNLEKFIGENLLNKIGILITVIGVAIGAKYSIENELISPLTRIVLGYVSAIGLFGFGMKLKKKYESYSAVLVSGAISILYFITFFAYSFYELIPQSLAFLLMVLFTGFTVVAALNYNKQIIAHLGLVGAYAVPFLLSNDSGRVDILFSYMAIVNAGILVIAFKKYWKPLYYTAFVMTWLIYSFWFLFDYKESEHFTVGLAFLFLFYILFYLTFLAYKLVKKEMFAATDIVLLLLNSFVFYGLGYAILSTNATATHYLGLFTLGNAIVHFIVAVVIYKQSLSDKKLFYLATALVLTFISIAIPVQLDGNWVTLLWTAQAVLLFWLGSTKKIDIYQKLSYPIMLLSFMSLLDDWDMNYDSYYITVVNQVIPLFNVGFFTSIMFVAAFGFILYLLKKVDFVSVFKKDGIWYQLSVFAIPIVFVFSLYYSFLLEIELFWDQLFYNSAIDVNGANGFTRQIKDHSLRDFKSVWGMNYTLFFIGVLAYLNFKKIKNKSLETALLILTLITILVFLVAGLYSLSELREFYLEPSEYYNSGVFYLLIRYVSFAFLGFAMLTLYRFIKKDGIRKHFKIAYDIVLHISIIWVVSSELLNWLDIAGTKNSYKLGLSILWGVYSFLLIGFGIWKNKPYLRIGGMALFAITLIKLFVYDIAHLNTISKTIVFVSLGVLLLIISFLYNKYKNQINYIDNEPKNKEDYEV